MRVHVPNSTSNTIGLLVLATFLLVADPNLAVDTCQATTPRDGSAELSPSLAKPGYGDREPIGKINGQIRRTWDEYGIRPSPQADEGLWCRRLYLDLLGRIPTVDELRRFLRSRSKSKREELVKRLLHGEEYADTCARNWTTIWTNALIGRSGGNDRNDQTNREGLQAYLHRALTSNKPYDRMVYELITATGVNTPGDPDFNGAVNFLVGKLDQKAVQATADTARLFLGLQVQCTQCHNHPFNRWKQNQFWQLNAFFRQTVSLRTFVQGTDEVRAVRLTDQDFAGEGDQPTPDQAEIYYELRNGILQVAYPVFVDGKPCPNLVSGYLEDVHRRNELGERIVQSQYMPRAIVNRMWAYFLGYGFTKPVDDMGPHNPPSHPELLEYLADQFRRHGYDLKQLIEWIVLSEPYGLSSKVLDVNASDDPAQGEPPKFSHYYMRQMRAEQLYQSLLVATQAHKTRQDEQEQERAQREWLKQFVITFGTDEGDETSTFNGTIPQALMMINGDLIRRATGADKGSLLSQIAGGNLRPVEKIEYLFLAGLARKPTRREVQVANQLQMAHEGDATAALRDLWWAVLNSNEFILNH